MNVKQQDIFIFYLKGSFALLNNEIYNQVLIDCNLINEFNKLKLGSSDFDLIYALTHY